jgi:hypothetical protein
MSLFRRRRNAEEKQNERDVKQYVRSVAAAQGTTPRALRKQARAEMKPFLRRNKRQEQEAKRFWARYDQLQRK